ncbi:tRNA(Ile)-lysidine synthase [Sphingomonas zeicaulis]|uniref:tRNA lysidine(34) synthetase TilS n=1 Tax=Sphingomonas zeicaulis TaxID=1632740 RepID=UPI003D2173B0
MPGGLSRRFAEDLGRLIGTVAKARIGIAVSGGADSLALLLLARDVGADEVAAATVDHGLRPAAAIEAAMVATVAAQLRIPHATLRPSAPIAGSVQANARAARYELLEEWRRHEALDWVLTAHHADDQAETLLMRLNRGSGVGGLAGIRAVNGHVVRPLLGWRRDELAAVVAAAGVEPVDDPSNRDPRFDRTRMRAALAEADWIDVPAVAASASHLADAEVALDWSVVQLEPARLRAEGDGVLLDAAGLPAELLRRLLRRALARLQPGLEPSGPEIDRLVTALAAGGKASIGALLAAGNGGQWRISPAPPRRAG